MYGRMMIKTFGSHTKRLIARLAIVCYPTSSHKFLNDVQTSSSSTSMDMDMLKEACGSFNFTLTAVPAAQQQAQPVLPQTISSGFAGSAFGAAAGLPLEPMCGGVPRPSVISGASLTFSPCSLELRLVSPTKLQWLHYYA